MEPRLAYDKAAPGAFQAMLGLEKYLHGCGLEPALIHMVKLRASQINGCAYCIDMHWKDARALGESEMRLYSLDAWHESPCYSDRERAALEWTEALTNISETHAEDAIFEQVRPHFTDKELADLTFLIAAINAWNRIAISMRSVPGVYQATKHK
jgi:AhpD family alkylhydroperoxidase